MLATPLPEPRPSGYTVRFCCLYGACNYRVVPAARDSRSVQRVVTVMRVTCSVGLAFLGTSSRTPMRMNSWRQR